MLGPLHTTPTGLLPMTGPPRSRLKRGGFSAASTRLDPCFAIASVIFSSPAVLLLQLFVPSRSQIQPQLETLAAAPFGEDLVSSSPSLVPGRILSIFTSHTVRQVYVPSSARVESSLSLQGRAPAALRSLTRHALSGANRYPSLTTVSPLDDKKTPSLASRTTTSQPSL